MLGTFYRLPVQDEKLRAEADKNDAKIRVEEIADTAKRAADTIGMLARRLTCALEWMDTNGIQHRLRGIDGEEATGIFSLLDDLETVEDYFRQNFPNGLEN
jgi:hypothetical protein